MHSQSYSTLIMPGVKSIKLRKSHLKFDCKYTIECVVIPNSVVLLLFHLLMYSKPPPKSRLLSKICLASCLLWLSQHNPSI